MNDSPEATAVSRRTPLAAAAESAGFAGMRGVVASAVVLAVLFCIPLYKMVRFALSSDLYSHLILIPFVTGYLIWLKKDELTDSSPPNRTFAIVAGTLGLVLLVGLGLTYFSTEVISREDWVGLSMASMICFYAAACAYLLGRKALRAILFPLCFLVFMVPIPSFVITEIETFLQHGSAFFAYVFLSMAGTPVFKQDLVFQLQGIRLQVAPECSGIHSSLALFITSVLGGYFFLRSRRNRAILALAVIPLALIRNGFRVFTLGELCVHIGPHMIDSPIHHHGGPIFFALSLIPFSLLLLFLIRSERRKAAAA